MSIRHLLDHVLTVWRATESTGVLRSVSRSWSSGSRTGLPGAIQVRGEQVGDTGGGERVLGKYLGFMLAGADVIEGDIVEVTAGPGVWGFLKVIGVSTPRGHHIELELEDTAEEPEAEETVS
jgi:hypothetical protein